MKARVYVSLKRTVLDPQGKTIHAALKSMGYDEIADVRQGKYFEIALAPGADASNFGARLEEISHDLLSNPVIEDYRIEFIE